MNGLSPSDIFIYPCDRCGAPFCERVQIMNLTLDYLEEQFCMACLAAELAKPESELSLFLQEYVQARECFKTPWDKFAPEAAQCPRLPEGSCCSQIDLSREQPA